MDHLDNVSVGTEGKARYLYVADNATSITRCGSYHSAPIEKNKRRAGGQRAIRYIVNEIYSHISSLPPSSLLVPLVMISFQLARCFEDGLSVALDKAQETGQDVLRYLPVIWLCGGETLLLIPIRLSNLHKSHFRDSIPPRSSGCQAFGSLIPRWRRKIFF